LNFGGNMQLSFVSQATQVIKNASTQVASGARSAGQAVAHWGTRLVEVLSTSMTHMASYARLAAAHASGFFRSCLQSTVAFCSAQPYFAAGIGIAATIALVFLATKIPRAHP
jgi:hypothetical protein